MKTNKIIAYLFLILVYVSFNFKVISAFISDYKLSKSKTLLSRAEISKAQKEINKSIFLNDSEPANFRQQAITYIASTLSENLSQENIKTLKTLALQNAERAYELQPYNLVNIKSLIEIYYFLSVKDLSKLESGGFDENFKNKTLDFFSKSEKLTQNDADSSLTLASYYKNLGEVEKSEKLYKNAKRLKNNL